MTMFNWGVQPRLLFVALAPMLVVALVLTAYYTHAQWREAESAFLARGQTFAQQLVATGEYAALSGNTTVLQQLIKTRGSRKGIRAATVVDRRGHILAHDGQSTTAAPQLVAPDGQHEDTTSARVIAPIQASWMSPLPEQETDAPPSLLGHVIVELDRNHLEAKQAEMLRTGLVTVFSALLLTLAFTILMSRSVSQPIRRISHAVEAIGRGHFDRTVPLVGGGSLRKLSEGVNNMAAQLASMREDMTRRVDEATAQLRARTHEAEQANNAKSRFLAAASHDLRQPMHALGLFVSELSQHELPTHSQHLLEQIAASAQSMEDLLDSLLDISKLDAGVLKPRVRPFALRPLLERLATAQRPALNSQGVRLFVRGDAAAWVQSDPLLLERILANLVSNAVRYTPDGRVLIACRRRGRHWRIEVRDNGPGIPEHAQSIIFQEFVQLDNPERTRDKGLGLGLAIVRRLTQLLEHRLELRSCPGQGSLFAIELPRAAQEPEQTTPSAHLPGAVTGMHVGIIDDDALALSALRSLLRSWGCTVTAADDLQSLVRQLAREARVPDFVLSDYRLRGGLCGLEVIRTLRALYKDDLPAALITADTSREALTRARHAGHPVLHKPVRPARLRALLNRARATQGSDVEQA